MDVRITIEQAPEPEPEFGAVIVCPVGDTEEASDPFDVDLGEELHEGHDRQAAHITRVYERFCRAASDMLNAVTFGERVMPLVAFEPRHHPGIIVPAGTEFEFTGFFPAQSPIYGNFEVPDDDPERAVIIKVEHRGHEFFLGLDEFERFEFIEDEDYPEVHEEPRTAAGPERVVGSVERAARGVTALRDRRTGVIVYQWYPSPADIERAASRFGPRGFDVVTFA
jgi:hypothetical protein